MFCNERGNGANERPSYTMPYSSRPRPLIIAECASNHGGEVDIARRMCDAALKAGADLVKFQAYEYHRLSPHDAQQDWLEQAELNQTQIRQLLAHDPHVFFSVFSETGLAFLRQQGVLTFKVGHADRWRALHPTVLWAAQAQERWFVSHAWGLGAAGDHPSWVTPMSVVPLYPAPLEALAVLPTLGGVGYSDHTVGLEACQIMLARGAPVIEKHFSIEGCPRRQPWDMDVDALARLVEWAKVCTTAQQGTAQSERWGP